MRGLGGRAAGPTQLALQGRKAHRLALESGQFEQCDFLQERRMARLTRCQALPTPQVLSIPQRCGRARALDQGHGPFQGIQDLCGRDFSGGTGQAVTAMQGRGWSLRAADDAATS